MGCMFPLRRAGLWLPEGHLASPHAAIWSDGLDLTAPLAMPPYVRDPWSGADHAPYGGRIWTFMNNAGEAGPAFRS